MGGSTAGLNVDFSDDPSAPSVPRLGISASSACLFEHLVSFTDALLSFGLTDALGLRMGAHRCTYRCFNQIIIRILFWASPCRHFMSVAHPN